MGSKKYLNNKRNEYHLIGVVSYGALLFCIMVILISGCITGGVQNDADGELPSPEIIEQEKMNRLVSDSRPNASHTLTREGYDLLCRKDYSGAIRLLERAVGINPSDGPGYYYLAEAWIGKENYKLAFQFNRLAAIYLRNSSTWLELTQEQKKKIKDLQ